MKKKPNDMRYSIAVAVADRLKRGGKVRRSFFLEASKRLCYARQARLRFVEPDVQVDEYDNIVL